LLTRCLETETVIKKMGLNPKVIRENGFSGFDFEFFLTDNLEDPTKYYVTAFWKKEDIKETKGKFNSWQSFISNANKKE